MATEPMTDARLAEIRRGLECGCYDQKWVGELMAEIDRLRTVAKCVRLQAIGWLTAVIEALHD